MQDRNTMPIAYELKAITTETGTGYYSSQPLEALDFEKTLELAQRYPNDEFMRRHLLRHVNSWSLQTLTARIQSASLDNLFLLSVLYEACLHNPLFQDQRELFSKGLLEKICLVTPLVFIRSSLLPDHLLHKQWMDIFRDNIVNHAPLPMPEEFDLPAPISSEELTSLSSRTTTMATYLSRNTQKKGKHSSQIVQISRSDINDQLERTGVELGTEMRHIASLSPIGVLRAWNQRLRVKSGRQNYTLSVQQTAYGRGLTMEKARLACAMEIVERSSAFASFESDHVPGYMQTFPLTYARASEIRNSRFLHPHQLHLEAPYEDTPLYWIEGMIYNGYNLEPILLPAQCVFLFCNLDEAKLFTSLGSTGLAAGGSLEMAKVNALLEVVERHCDSTCLFDPQECFELTSQNPYVASLLADYKRQGIHVQFQDISSQEGIPCYRAFVETTDGQIITGTAAHLDAKQAIVSAMTEVAYPYPCQCPTTTGIPGVPQRDDNELPDYSAQTSQENLQNLEVLLSQNGCWPVYVNLTRKKFGYPVVRALLPGTEMLGDMDEYSRVHPRLYTSYLQQVDPHQDS